MSSSIPAWQILTAHAQPFRGARNLAFCLKVPLNSLLVWASSGCSGETARMRRLAWTFAARIGDKYQIRLTRPNWIAVKCFWLFDVSMLVMRKTHTNLNWLVLWILVIFLFIYFYLFIYYYYYYYFWTFKILYFFFLMNDLLNNRKTWKMDLIAFKRNYPVIYSVLSSFQTTFYDHLICPNGTSGFC